MSTTATETAPIFTKYLTLAQSAANETESIVEYSKQFFSELADENIDALFPRQGQLNDKHTEKLLARFKMAQQQQQQQLTPAAATATALPMVETQKKVDTVVVPLTPEKKKKTPLPKQPTATADDDGDADDDVDDKVPPKGAAKKKSAEDNSASADDESGDGDTEFNEALEKVATGKKETLKEVDGSSGSDDGEDDASSQADSVDLEIASDGGEESSDEEYGSDLVDGGLETPGEKYSSEVASRLLRTSKESLNEKIKLNAEIVRKMTPADAQEESDDDDDEEFQGSGEGADNADDDAASSGGGGGGGGGVDDDDDDDTNNAETDDERPRKKAKTGTLQSAMKKGSSSTSKSKTVRIAAGDDVGEENTTTATEPPKKKAKVIARASSMSVEEKAIASLQQMRMSERYKKKKEWVSTQVLKDVITIACTNIFMRDHAKREGKTFTSFFKTMRNDTDNDELVQRLRLNLLNLTMQIQSALSMSKMHGNEVMQEVTDFVRNSKDVQVVDKAGSKHIECGILGLNFAPEMIDKFEAHHYTSGATTMRKTMFICAQLRDLVDAMAFLVNFEERLEELTKKRLVCVLGYKDGKTGAAEAARLLRDDKAHKSAHELLRIRLKTCIDTVDRSMRIIKTAQSQAVKE